MARNRHSILAVGKEVAYFLVFDSRGQIGAHFSKYKKFFSHLNVFSSEIPVSGHTRRTDKIGLLALIISPKHLVSLIPNSDCHLLQDLLKLSDADVLLNLKFQFSVHLVISLVQTEVDF